MLIAFSLFFLGVIMIAGFVIYKVPLLKELSEEPIKDDNSFLAKEKIEEKVKKEVKEIFEDFLHLILQTTRKIIIKIERITTKWLYLLKRKRKKKSGDNKPE